MAKKVVGKVNKVVLRQFQLYLVLIACEVASYEEIFGKILYTNDRMLRRDVEDLCKSGLLKVVYSTKDKGYVHADQRGKELYLEEDLKSVYLFPKHPRQENPDKNTAQLYRLVDMLYRHLSDEMAWERESQWQASSVWVSDDPFDIWVYEDYFCDHEGDMMRTCRFTIPKQSPFEENYYLMFPNCSRKDFLNDLAILSEFSQAWGIDVEPISMKEEWLALKEKEPAMSLYSEDGSPLEPEDLEDYFWVDVTTWTGIPCKLPPNTIAKAEFPPMKGHKWGIETEEQDKKDV